MEIYCQWKKSLFLYLMKLVLSSRTAKKDIIYGSYRHRNTNYSPASMPYLSEAPGLKLESDHNMPWGISYSVTDKSRGTLKELQDLLNYISQAWATYVRRS